MDRLTADVTFRQTKPQILFFEDLKVAKFPKALSSVKRKLATGRALTKKEANALLEFQLKQSVKAKPIGFTSKESEIVLAPGEILKKQKTLAITIIDGRRVPIIKTTIFKPKGQTKRLLTQFRKGGLTSNQQRTLNSLSRKKKLTGKEKAKFKSLTTKKGLTKKEQKRLDSLLKKQTGFDYGIRSSTKTSKRFVSLKRVGLSGLLTRARRIRPSRPSKPSRVSRRPSRPSKPSRPSRPSKPSRPGRPSKPSRISPRKVSRARPSPRVPKRPPIRPPIKPPVKPPVVPPIKLKKKVRRPKKKKRKVQAFKVVARPRRKKGKKRPKLVKVSKVPLRRKDAKDLRNFIADDSLARTSAFKKTPGKPQKPRLKVPPSFAKKTKKKFRTFRRVKGKKKALPKGTVIERRKFLLDRSSERRQIGLRKRISLLAKQSKRRTLLQSRPKQTRKQMLKNLSRARSMRGKVRVKSLIKRKPVVIKISVSASKRKQMLANLEKARKVRLSNLRKKKKKK